MALVVFHLQNSAGNPLAGVAVSATSLNGDWSSITNAAGDVVDPGSGIAGVNLAPGDYHLSFLKAGYADRPLDAHIVECGQIRHALDVGGGGGGGGTLPAKPTRDQVCALKTSLQGLTYNTLEFGPIPAWFYAALSPEDRAVARAAHMQAGDTHIPIPISEAYRESGTLWPDELREGYDFTNNLGMLRAMCSEVIEAGFFVDMPLAGDGHGAGPGYNDPVGKTYGYEWLIANLPRIIAGLQGNGTDENPDLTPYILFRPGWDAVFYGWGVPGEVPDQQPDRVRQFGQLFRQLCPGGYLAIEHTPGNIPCGEGGSDYAPGGLMQNFDTVLSEFKTVHEDSCWQIVARMVPHYNRPADQPTTNPDGTPNDPNPPHYLAPGNPRGRYFYVAFEPTTGGVYEWSRGLCTLDDVENVRQYLKNIGCELTG